jgi:hypothetical protein
MVPANRLSNKRTDEDNGNFPALEGIGRYGVLM